MKKNRNWKALMTAALSAVLFVSILCPVALAESSPTEDGPQIAETEVATGRQGRRGNSSEMDRNAKESRENFSRNSENKANHNGHTETAEPENSIGEEAAVSKALADAGIEAEQAENIRVRVAKNKDGVTVYKVCFSSNGQCYYSEVDAVSGELLCNNVQTENSDTDRQGRGKDRINRNRIETDTNF